MPVSTAHLVNFHSLPQDGVTNPTTRGASAGNVGRAHETPEALTSR
jgi:hypothetical protein